MGKIKQENPGWDINPEQTDSKYFELKREDVGFANFILLGSISAHTIEQSQLTLQIANPMIQQVTQPTIHKIQIILLGEASENIFQTNPDGFITSPVIINFNPFDNSVSITNQILSNSPNLIFNTISPHVYSQHFIISESQDSSIDLSLTPIVQHDFNNTFYIPNEVTINGTSISELNGEIVFNLLRLGNTPGITSVDYKITNLSTNSFDTSLTTGTVFFLDGQISQTITITINNENIYEYNESFVLELFNPINLELLNNQATGTIINDDSKPSFSIDDITISESDGTAVFTITKSGLTQHNSSIDYNLSDGTATSSNNDFVNQSGTLTFLPNETSKTITVNITDDNIFENTENYFINLSNPVDATIADNQGIGTITNDDSAPSFSINDITVNEADGIAVFTVMKSGDTDVASAVDFNLSDGTATVANSDYVTQSGTLNFLAGETTKTITVNITDNSTYENNENFTVDLSNAINSTISDNQGIGTITNDDLAPSFSINDIAVNEADGTAVFTVTKSGLTDLTSSVDFNLSDGTATVSNNDYTSQSGTLNFLAGETTKTITVNITDNSTYENTENFTVDLSNAIDATISDNQGIGTITNDDLAPSFSIDDITVNEADGTAVFTVTKSGLTDLASSVDFNLSDGTATVSNNDYTSQSGTLNFLAGETTKTITVNITDNSTYENTENFTVDLSNAIDATISDNQGIGTITNDDTAPSFSINDVVINEADGTAVFTVTKLGTTDVTSTVDFNLIDGTAEESDSDYTAQSGTLTFLAGETTQTITVNITDDNKYENNESLLVNLSNPIDATISDNQGSLVINNDDALPSFSVDDVVVNEADGTLTFTITKNTPSQFDASVNYATADNTATIANGDYVATSGILNFSAVENSKTVTVTINNNSIYELSESFYLNLSSPVDATILDSQGIGTITNDDAAPSFSIDDVSVQEDGGTIVFTVTKTGSTDVASSVDFATADNTATVLDNDYTAQSGTLNFLAGETTKTITITINDNTVDELDEIFYINLSNPIDATIADSQGEGTIINNDPQFSINDVSVDEDAGTMVFTVTKIGTTTGTSTVDFATSDGTAFTSDSDYVGQSGTLTFLFNESSKTITINITDDSKYEYNENLTVTLTNPTNGFINDGAGIGTINNQDAAPVFTIDDQVINEADGTVTFTITKSGLTQHAATVDFTTTDGTATVADGDYVAQSGTLNFAAGETTKTVVVTVNDESKYEYNESFTLDLSNPVDATVGDAQGTATINNDDNVPTYSINDVSRNENTGSITFTVTKSGSTAIASSVDYSTADGTATVADNDYTAQSGTLNFAAGESSKTITITVNDDITDESDENFTVTLSNPIESSIIDGTGIGTIQNDDPSFVIDNVSVNEDAGTLTFTVTKTGITSDTSTVDYATEDNSATVADGDYTAVSGTLTFLSNEFSKTITVNIADNPNYEGNENFLMRLSNVTNGYIADSSGAGTILETDPAPIFSIDDVTVNEADGTAVFTVTKSGNTDVSSSVDFDINDGTATTANSDYTDQSGTLTFLSGETTKTITVNITDNSTYENTENFTVDLSNAVDAVITDSQGLGTITNDDTAPSFSIDDVVVNEADGTAVFTVTKTGSTDLTSTVDFNLNDGTATVANSDYIDQSGTLTFLAGEATKTITVNIINNTTGELDENFTVDLSNSTNATITDNQGQGTILNDDGSVPTAANKIATPFDLSNLNGTNGFTINGIDTGDNYGYSVSSAGDVNNDGFMDFIIGAPNAGSAGEVALIFGKASSFGSSFDIEDLLITNGGDGSEGVIYSGISASDAAGTSVNLLGDINNDGFSDFAIGVPGGDEGFIIFGKASGYVAEFDLTDLTNPFTNNGNGVVLNGIAASDNTGISIKSAGDINGDGLDDLIIGADNGNSGTGEAYVVFGSTGFSYEFDLSDLLISNGGDGTTGFVLKGEIASDLAGQSVSTAGDINGDGFSDLVVGAPGADKAYVFFGKASGFSAEFNLSDLESPFQTDGMVINGITASDNTGISVTNLGDINADGFDDMLIGASDGNSGTGQAYVIFGSNSFSYEFDLSDLLISNGGDGSTGFVLHGIDANDNAGQYVESAGDVNGDGYLDFIIGAHSADESGNNTGEAYLIYGKASFGAEFNLTDLTNPFNTDGVILYGPSVNDEAGRDISSAGDINNDGFDDILIGGPGSVSGTGESYIVYGSNSDEMVIGTTGDDTLEGRSGLADMINAGLGDDTIDSKGGADFINGAGGDDEITYYSDLRGVDGGSGFDNLVISDNDVDLDLTTYNSGATGNAPLLSIESIDLGLANGSNDLTLGYQDLVKLSESTNKLYVKGDASDTVNMTGPETWVQGSDELLGGITYNSYSVDNATLLVQDSVTVVI